MNKPSTRAKSAPAAAKASASLQEPASGFSYSRPFFEELVDRALAHAKKLGATDAGAVFRKLTQFQAWLVRSGLQSLPLTKQCEAFACTYFQASTAS